MPRSGTGSLAKLINSCKNSHVSHETHTHLSYDFDKKKLLEKLEVIFKMSGKYIGDVGHYYLNYLDYFIRYKDAKVVCMKRDKFKVIQSMKKTPGWNVYKDTTRKDKFPFPQIDKSFEIAAGIHHSIYYKKIRKLKNRFPSKILILHVDELNHREGVHKLFNFLKIDKEDRVYNVGIREHKELGL